MPAGIGSETRFEVVEPNAPAMIESMRSVGYTAQAAVADLVDNSISAQARNVWVDIPLGWCDLVRLRR